MFKPCAAPVKDDLFHEILALLVEANHILRQQYQQFLTQKSTFNVQLKADQSAVTQADFYVNHFISSKLQLLSEKYPVLSEEGIHNERHKWSTFWLLDPLDGTKEFLAQRPEFTINLSLIREGKTVFAAIAVPEKHCIYIGYLSEVPFKYHTLDDSWSLYDTSHVPLNTDCMSIGVSHRADSIQMDSFLKKLEQIKPLKLIRAGSAYKFCLMLEGEINIYPRFHPTCEWDTSAGQCLLESIGGGLYAMSHTPFVYNQRPSLLNGNFIAFTDLEYAKYAFACL